MIYIAAGLALIVNLLLLASESSGGQLPFIISLLMLVLLFCLRAFLHLKEEDHLLARLDVFLAMIFSITSIVLFAEVARMAVFYVDTLSDLADQAVIFFIGLNVVVLLPFVVVSLLALYHALRHVRRKER
ncbi:hypothetical protein GF367_01330 [Candidatus Woesearchaeota archaeon]|nr:hypothetical protein [Candidatus Woesearchaeota archaeon]